MARASRNTHASPVCVRRASIAAATTSRGARSPIGWVPAVTDWPWASTSTAPSPRSASVMSGRRPVLPGSNSMVGWNWTNSTSLTAIPAHIARAMPSPVEPSGLVVAWYRCPRPPVAMITEGAWMTPGPSSLRTRTPDTVPSSSIRSTATWLCRTSSRVAASSRARWTSAPVASPPAWMMRCRVWPPSRVSAQPPAADSSNRAPHPTRSVTARYPSATIDRTASGSHSPAPAASVSATCASTESSVSRKLSGNTTAMPPCA